MKKQKREWKPEEIALLKKVYKKSTPEELEKMFHRNIGAISMQANRLRLKSSRAGRGGSPWTSAEIEILKKKFSNTPKEELMKLFEPRTYDAIQKQANKNNLRRERIPGVTVPAPFPQEDPEQAAQEQLVRVFGKEILMVGRLPKMSADKPFVIDSPTGVEPMVLNSFLVGSLTTEDDETDQVKNSLRLAEALHVPAVIVTGDLIYTLTQRYGNQRPYKTQVSGVKVDPKKVEASYPKAVREHPDFESVETRLKNSKSDPLSVVFVTLSTQLDHNMEMLRQIFLDKGGKPIYSGPIYVAFGKLEDDIMIFLVNELVRIGAFKSKAWGQKVLMELQAEWRKKDTTTERRKKIAEEMKDFKAWLNHVAIMGNVAHESTNQARKTITSYMIRKYEENIPNAKVISVGDAYLKFDGKLIMVTTDKDQEGFMGKLSGMLARKTESFTKGHNPNRVPDVILGMGLNPYLDVKFVTLQASQEPGDKRMCTIVQLPMCVDAERYRGVVRDQNILRDIITRSSRQSGFESGVITLRWVSGVATPVITSWRSVLLKNREIFKSPQATKDFLLNFKLMYLLKEGCTHVGASDVKVYKSPNDPSGRYLKYHHQVVKEMLLATDAPIVMYHHDGDATQGLNHEYWKIKHPEYLTPEELIAKIQNMTTEELRQFALEQRIFGGTYQLDEQVDSYVKSVVPYLNFFIKLLKLAKKVGLNFNGTLSAVMHIMGNHCKNTHKKKPSFHSDAREINNNLKAALFKHLIENSLGELKDQVDTQLTSPAFGDLGEGRGSFSAPGGQRYALVLKHKQGNMNATQKRASQRGVDEHEVGLPVINLSGDDHRGGYRETRDMVHVKTGGQQDEGAFGREIDFSEQNVFSTGVGIPVGGFANGPVTYITFDAETARRYAQKPVPIDGNELFRNALK